MKITKSKIISIIIAIIPLILVLLIYKNLPNEIPTHWNLNGTVTYGAKYNLIFLSSLGIILTLVHWISPKIDPKKTNYTMFQKHYDYICIVINLFILFMTFITISESLYPGKIEVSKAVTFLVGILFICIGNVLPKIKDNFFVGIKTPWTISNPIIWNKTHRLGGFIFVICGLLISVFSLIIKNNNLLFGFIFVALMFTVFVPTVMSYIWFKKQ